MRHLFVYGTLMPGGEAHHLIAARVASWRGASVVGALYRFPEGWPALLLPGLHALHDPPGAVQGALCALHPPLRSEADWAELDAWEDHRPGDPTSLFVRAEAEVVAEDGEVVRAGLYVWNPGERAMAALRRRAWHLPEGRFRP